MNFKIFLNESRNNHREKIDEDHAIEIIKKYCLENFELSLSRKRLYRGFADYGNDPIFMHINNTLSKRTSAQTSNHYTILTSHYLKKKGAADRSFATICSNTESWADNFGDVYVIIPYDGTKVTKIYEQDMWRIECTGFDGKTYNLPAINTILNKSKISANGTFEDIVSKIKERVKVDKDLASVFGETDKTVDEYVEKIYNIRSSTKILPVIPLQSPAEVWFTGKAVAIKLDKFDEFAKKIDLDY